MEDTPGFEGGHPAGRSDLEDQRRSRPRGCQSAGCVDVLRGEPGKKITLTILRPSTKEIKDYALEREEIKVQSVKDAQMLDRS